MRRVIAGVLAWVAFVVGWALAARGEAEDALAGAGVLLLSAATALGVARAWQAHNKALYRRRGPRRSSPRQDRAWEQDRVGQRLHFGGGLDTATEVVLAAGVDGKTYRAAT